ncbi:hypothetical protein [Hahella ganghwensis]|uniref:hypothetical protein n=1 Tax=Hahella ganghwensis TaxID=286420 RepID=UPI0003660C8A|nr:hypothetical protein [Hahella ganghwensis]
MKNEDFYILVNSSIIQPDEYDFNAKNIENIFVYLARWKSSSIAFDTASSQEEIKVFGANRESYESLEEFAVKGMVFDREIDNKTDLLDTVCDCEYSIRPVGSIKELLYKYKRNLNIDELVANIDLSLPVETLIVVCEDWDYFYMVWADKYRFHAFSWWTLA